MSAIAEATHTGRIVQVIGSTFDAEFTGGHLPEIYHALRVESEVTTAGPASGSALAVPASAHVNPITRRWAMRTGNRRPSHTRYVNMPALSNVRVCAHHSECCGFLPR